MSIKDLANKEKDILKPRTGSIWKNKNSKENYVVLNYTNETSTREDYPIYIHYKRLNDGSRWTRRLNDWHRSYSITNVNIFTSIKIKILVYLSNTLVRLIS